MTQKRGNNRYGWRSFLILLVVVVVGGYALWAQGSLVSPLQMTQMITSMMSRQGDDGFTMAPPEGAEGRQRPEGESSGRPEGDGETTSLLSFSWDQIGNVFYNLWVMLAATVVVIVVSKPVGWVVKRLKQPRRPAAA